ncbi:MAG: crossover junction endodeoxyribonuclease RuvC [Candidatus Neomarinimicrobiota bacterium]|nr:crossover junction endodeoxyribonuclease RuvC [Candidatus Neomarinimicrobiota bacterium]MCD6099498.1 crossover junction endodeoxyribonuclease RuvC [Candidatus Neomarinimicrobiota bacterium]RKY47217.1 MAG: crossover junction endodeoxyribonuclease RuvC [Candidatus Neomarinimicrobiota bacterium]RKY48231.1 MAG: crossover junction endodeoxyribonuclease RuvC [Candidatus Neomarinimicrobiota bacterium]RKY51829.1 MAG: crossover junction endodeoxyribonuclease RuvC [Candidatus Neomarinimicrobiota bacte
MDNDVIIIGVDPGLSKTGYGIVARRRGELSYIASGVISTSSRKSFPLRIKKIYRELREILKEYNPGVMVVEEAIYVRNAKTALMLGQARGVILLAAIESGLVVKEFSPAKIKVAVVGNGSATKEQVNYMVANILGLKGKNLAHDETDALAGAICYLFQNERR